MAKKFVRGVTGIEDIESYDKTLTNVNDILSDGQDTYVHTKKGKTESYYKLTDSLKSITSDNSDLITVTKDDTTNTVTIHPKHDAQKEQSIESTRGTVSIQKGGNGTSETTKVDTNPQKVLEHDNLMATDGLEVVHTGNNSTIKIASKLKQQFTNTDTLSEGFAYGKNLNNSYLDDRFNSANYITLKYDENKNIQLYMRESGITTNLIVCAYRFIKNNVASSWKEMSVDTESLNSLLSKKQNTLQNNTSIAVSGSGLRQLYTLKQTYTVTGGLLKTHVKSISENTNINTAEEEFNFIVKINKGASSVNFTLNSHDSTKFQNIIATYGADNTVRISGCVFTLSGSTLTVSTTNNTAQNYVITFSDII